MHGNLTKTTYPNNATATRTYTSDDLLQQLSDGTLGYTYAYSLTNGLT